MRFVRSLTLQQFCLHIIVENLERFFTCHSVPQRHIDFLLRVYSEEIFKRVREINAISEKFLLWFLNRYSKKIILPFVTEKITNRLQIIGPAITSLDLQKSTAGENMINSIILHVPNVTHLNLSGTRCSDPTLLYIQKSCPDLVSLELADCKWITGNGMINFCDISLPLKYLNLMGTCSDFMTLASILNKIPQIESLKYKNLPHSFHVINTLSLLKHTKYNLTELIYEQEVSIDPGIVINTWTCLCPNIRKVYLGFSVPEKVFDMLSQFQDLEDLEIYNTSCYFYEGRNFDPLRHEYSGLTDLNRPKILTFLLPISRRLTSLKITNASISIQLLLENFYKLKVLGLRRINFLHVDDNVTLRENCLETLVIHWTILGHTSNKALELLLSLSKKVTKLCLTLIYDLYQWHLDVIINSMKELSFIDIRGTNSSLLSVSKFAEIPSMTTMYFDKTLNSCHNLSLSEISFKTVNLLTSTNTLLWNGYFKELSNENEELFFHNPFL